VTLLAGETDCVSESAVLVSPPESHSIDVALLLLHDTIVLLPVCMVVGVTEREQVGAIGASVTTRVPEQLAVELPSVFATCNV
jgi:hypothetical protein